MTWKRQEWSDWMDGGGERRETLFDCLIVRFLFILRKLKAIIP